MFQQDDALIYKAKDLKSFFEENKTRIVEWPPYSPYSNPIEHVQGILEIILAKKHPNLEDLKVNKEDQARLWQCLLEAWRAIEQKISTFYFKYA